MSLIRLLRKRRGGLRPEVKFEPLSEHGRELHRCISCRKAAIQQVNMGLFYVYCCDDAQCQGIAAAVAGNPYHATFTRSA